MASGWYWYQLIHEFAISVLISILDMKKWYFTWTRRYHLFPFGKGQSGNGPREALAWGCSGKPVLVMMIKCVFLCRVSISLLCYYQVSDDQLLPRFFMEAAKCSQKIHFPAWRNTAKDSIQFRKRHFFILFCGSSDIVDLLLSCVFKYCFMYFGVEATHLLLQLKKYPSDNAA